MTFGRTKRKENLKEGATFKSTQIYNIHVNLGRTQDKTNVVAIVFDIPAYSRALELLLLIVPEWKPETVHITSLISSVSTLKKAFSLSVA